LEAAAGAEAAGDAGFFAGGTTVSGEAGATVACGETADFTGAEAAGAGVLGVNRFAYEGWVTVAAGADGAGVTFNGGVGCGAGTWAGVGVVEAGTTDEGDDVGEVAGVALAAGAALSLAGASGFGVVAGGRDGLSFRMSDERLRCGVGAGAFAGVTAAGLGAGERSFATAAAPAASNDAPVIVSERLGGVDSSGSGEAEEGTEGVEGVAVGEDAEGADGFAPTGGAVTDGSGDVAGRFALLAESFCEGRMAVAPDVGGVRAGTVGGGVIWAVGASPDGTGFLVAVAGRAGMTGACAEPPGTVSAGA
jgi:hypothetical protein